MTTDRLLTPDEAATFLGVEPSTLACWRSTKRYALTWIRVGSLVRYRRSDLEQFLESHAERPKAHCA